MDVYSLIKKYNKENVDYDSLYEKNAATNEFVIKFDSREDADAAVIDYQDLDKDTKILVIIQDDNQVNIKTDIDVFIELLKAGEIDTDDVTTMFALIGIISFNHNCVLVDEIGHALITRR